jgi:acyl-CoA hydrolase
MAPEEPTDRTISTTRIVRAGDLNHHETLYGARCVEWCVEMAYITAANCFDEVRPIVFMSIRSLSIRAPARQGDMIEFTGRVDYVGESTIGIRVDARTSGAGGGGRAVATGTFLFCTVDESGSAEPHGLPEFATGSSAGRNRWKETAEGATTGAK